MVTHAQSWPGILLVDDHRGIREALALLLEANDLAVFAQASTRSEALAQVAARHPGLALVDVSLGNEDGLALVADLNRLGVPVVVCSSHEEPVFVWRALDSGARAYVSKRDANRALVRTLRDVLDGWVLISPRAADSLPNGPYPIQADVTKLTLGNIETKRAEWKEGKHSV